MTKPFTPYFIQIVATEGPNLYGLTADGQVYKWAYVRDPGPNTLGGGNMQWVLLESEI